MKKSPTKFRVGDIVRIKPTVANRNLMHNVWLGDGDIALIINKRLTVNELDGVELGRNARYSCHKVEGVKVPGGAWIPPIALTLVRRKGSRK